VLEISGQPVLFCGFCGQRLPKPVLQSTTAERATGADAPTQPPSPEPASAVEKDPDIVGGYRLLRRLGGGGMGTLFEAEDTATGRHVALKLIAPEYAESTDAVERFRREGRLASAIAHPRCVFVLAADEEAGRPYIVMELMPGATLADLLKEQGRLAPEEAVAKILDVIDGLREAHRLGVIHRDVKPSNCFLEADGRVKIGDFGLAKSLLGDAHRTGPGQFLGTPLFASPEQVRGEGVGPQSDVYSVAATLYCLLTGKAPFEGGDAVAILARIAADPVPSMRTRRPELSPALDRVVLRGLERDRQRRWRSLDEFREALLDLLPGRQTAGRRGPRFAAFMIDFVILQALLMLCWRELPLELLAAAIGFRIPTGHLLAGAAIWVLYFVVLEWLWGCTPGKWLLRLRVCGTTGSEPPGLGQTLLRNVVFHLLMMLGILVYQGLFPSAPNPRLNQTLIDILSLALCPLEVLGIGLLLWPMRRHNGWRGLHELASRTRVIQRPKAEKRWALHTRRLSEDVARPRELPQWVGPYAVHGALRWADDVRVLLGEDQTLSRWVLLWLRPQGASPLNPARRECGRPTRLRWLACGSYGDWQWDAILAPSGHPLTDLVAAEGRLSWPETRALLEQLAQELAVAAAELTLPQLLRVDQVWIDSHGGLQLLDVPLAPEPAEGGALSDKPLALLGSTARLALEGQPGQAAGPIRAPLPGHATRLLGQLVGQGKQFQVIWHFRQDLKASHEQPAQVTRLWRTAHVAAQVALLVLGFGCCMWPAFAELSQTVPIEDWHLSMPNLSSELQEDRRGLQELEEGAAQDYAAGIINPQPLARLASVYQLSADLSLRDQLREIIETNERAPRALPRPAPRFSRFVFGEKEELKEAKEAKQPPAPVQRAGPVPRAIDFRGQAGARLARARLVRVQTISELSRMDPGPVVPRQLIMHMVLVMIWPTLWVLSALLFGGGLTVRMVGLSLVCGDGCMAGLLRCAARALLIWIPPTMLLAAAVMLDAWPWFRPEVGEPRLWAFRLADVLLWTSVGLLLAYPVVAILFPRRGPHDWLVGTYVVPR
jgi:hypothetical protein